MIAGCKFRGEFEERLKNVLSEVDRLGDRVVLFIDEVINTSFKILLLFFNCN